MEYFVESINLDLLKIDLEYKALCESKNDATNSEISDKREGLIKRAWNKIKQLIQRIKNFFTKNKVEKNLDEMSKKKGNCEIKIPEGETATSFKAKIDLFIKKLKNKKLTNEEIDNMKDKMVKGIKVTVSIATAAVVGKTLLRAIPVCDSLVAEYDDKRANDYEKAKEDKRNERVGHVKKYKENYKKEHDANGTGPVKYGITHAISGLLSIAQDGIGNIINAVPSKKQPVKYNEMTIGQRINANDEIRELSKRKAAAAKDNMKLYKDAMIELKNKGKENSAEFNSYKKKYDLALSEYNKYKKVRYKTKK